MEHAEVCAHYEREFLRHIFTQALAPGAEREIAATHTLGAREGWFTSEERRLMLQAMRATVEAGGAPDSLSVYEHARRKGFSEVISDEQTLVESHLPAQWPDGGLMSLSMDRAARWLSDESKRRKKAGALKDAAEQLSTGNSAEAAERMASAMFEELEATQEVCTVRDLLGAVMAEAIDPPAEDQRAGTLPLFDGLEEFVGRLAPGSLTVIGGGPSDGKSATMLQGLITLAAYRERPFYISGEDPIETVQARLAMKFAKVRRADPRLIGFEQQKLLEAFYKLEASKNSWVARPRSRQLADFRALMRSAVSRYGATVLFVDYLQVMQAPGSDFEKTNACVNAVKEEGQQLGVPVILGSQFNRSGREQGTEPFMSSIRGSGVVEEVAENIFLLWRTGEYPNEMRHLKIAKAKSGRAGIKFNLDWREDGRMCVGLTDYSEAEQAIGGSRY